MPNENVLYRNHMNLADRADLENATADAVGIKAIIDYLAMMCDVEIPTEDGDGNVSEI